MKIKRIILDSVILVGNLGLIFIFFLTSCFLILAPAKTHFNDVLIKQIFFYFIFPLLFVGSYGHFLMLWHVTKNRKKINSRLWYKILFISWFYGSALYYFQVFRKNSVSEGCCGNSVFERVLAKISNNRRLLDLLFVINICASVLFFLTWLMFLFSPIVNPDLSKIFWIYPLKLFILLALSWITLYWLAITDRSQRTDAEVGSIDPMFVDFPYVFNVGKGLFKYYLKVMRKEENASGLNGPNQE